RWRPRWQCEAAERRTCRRHERARRACDGSAKPQHGGRAAGTSVRGEPVKVDVVVVGTGPGGYVAAIRCAQLGLSVAAVEDDRPGGVCLNWGCIPTKARAVILATGSEPKSLPGVPIDEKTVISSNGAVRNEESPKSIIVIGAGAVGVEFADVYASYGVQVTILEALPRLVPLEDEEVSKELARAFRRRSIEMKTGVKVASVKPGGAGVAVETDAGRLEAEQVLMAVGRAAKVTGLGLEPLGVRLDRGFVTVSPRMETSVPGVYAIGDMVGPPLLAHKAMAEGVVAAEAIAGREPRPLDYGNVPACTYCRPQIASLGLTEERARENGREVSVGKFPFTASGKAVALGDTEGFVKVVADKATGEILGVHIVGPEATEIIHEFAVGRTVEATLEEIIHT